MSFLGLCRGSLSNRTIAAATLQPLRTKNASDEAFWGFLLVSIWFMYGKSWCVCVCVCVARQSVKARRGLCATSTQILDSCVTGIFVRSLAHSLGCQTRARVAQWPPLRKCLSLSRKRDLVRGVRISLSRIDDHLARAIVIFSLSRGTYCCGCCCCCCCSYPPVLPSRPESTS